MRMKSFSTLMGLGLIVLWAVSLGSPSATRWLTWLDGLAALVAFGLSAFSAPYPSRRTVVIGPFLIALGLFAMWMVGLNQNVVPWQGWWTFAFACGFLLLSIVGMRERRIPSIAEVGQPTEKERIRKGA